MPDAWVSLGAVYVNTGKPNDAIAIFDDAINRFPATTSQQIPELYHNFGLALGKIGRTDEGIEKLKLALNANPELPPIWLNLGAFYQASGKFQDSIDHYKEFLKRSPNDPDAPIIVDTIKILEEELKEASTVRVRSNEEHYAEGTKKGPTNWSPTSMPLRVHIRSDDGNSSVQHPIQ
jgi:tetratricopeptide (TPR) repeat protein